METNEILQKHINAEVKQDIEHLYNHADIANKEMGTIKTDIAVLKSEFVEMKKSIKSVDSKQWAIIVLIVTAAVAIILSRNMGL